MALYKCPECGHMVSDKADACPNCGCKIRHIIKSYSKSPLHEKPNDNRNLTIIILALCALITALALIAIFLYKAKTKNKSNPAPTKITAVSDSIAQDTISLTPIERDSVMSKRDSIAMQQAQQINRIKEDYKLVLKEAENKVKKDAFFDKKPPCSGYFLHDITGDDIPEIWVRTGGCSALDEMSVYSHDGKNMKKIGDFGPAWCFFEGGHEFVLATGVHTGTYTVLKIICKNGKLKYEEIESGSIDSTNVVDECLGFEKLNNYGPINRINNKKI